MTSTPAQATPRVKVVVWDLDGTVWDEVAVELPEGVSPQPRGDVLEAMERLRDAGILNSVASRTSPAVVGLLRALPRLWPLLVEPQCGWHDKSRSLTRLATDLGIAVESLVLVDDSAFERAEVEGALPGVRTFDREGLLAALPRLLPAEVTPEAASRTAHYQAEAGRRGAATSYADREAFLASCDLRLSITTATTADRARVVELAARAHRLSSTTLRLDEAVVDAWLTDPGRELLVGRLTDRFGDYGLIALAAVRREEDARVIELLAVSCRVAGRGVAEAFLREVLRRGGYRGFVELPLRVTPENVELRLLVRATGFELTGDGEPPAGILTARRAAADVGPGPAWIRIRSDQAES